MIIHLTGKRAIVTGSTSGIGLAIARGLAEAGAAVVVNGRTQKSVNAAIKRLAQHVPQVKVEGIAADLAAAAGVTDFIKRVSETDILVNNLGIFAPKPFAEITDEDWQRFLKPMS
jgi:NAD(P)-dependent dehydrogenase (short-subunit alcohol dehydrogenase family)